MNKIEKRKCIVCEKTFEYRTEGTQGKHYKIKNYRGKNMLTCSPRCSKTYEKICNNIKSKKRKNEEK